jgi:hypothetical protein
MSVLAVLDATGDTRLQWDKNNHMEVQAAKARFDELKAKRYFAYKVNKQGEQGEVIHDFDPAAERIMMVPPMVGG